MVDQPEGRPKSPAPGKVKQVTKKHNVSKPYERPSSSRGVLARVKDLITPVTPGWLKDLVLRPPETTSVTDALELTVAEVQSVEEKKPEEFKNTLKSLTIPLPVKNNSNDKLPITSERTPQAKKKSSSILDVTTTPNYNTSRTNVLEETLSDLKWSSIRPAVKEKYSFSVAAFNTPSKSPNLSAISIHNRSLNKSSSPYNRSKLSFGGTSLQRSLLQQRSSNTSTVIDDKKHIKVKPISRSTIRPGVTSNTAKKILEQLESLSKPLGHLPSSRPSTPGSRPGSRASTPVSLSRPSTPQHLQPYGTKSERSIPIRSLTAAPLEKVAESRSEISIGGCGKIKREKTNHYSRVKEEEKEFVVPDFKTVSIPKKEFQPINLGQLSPKPIKIVNQTQQKDIPKPLKKSFSPLLKMKAPSPINDDNSSSDSSFSFSAPISVTNSVLSISSISDTAEFSFGVPANVHEKSVESVLKSTKSVEDILNSVKSKEEVKIPAKEPPGSWSCVSCKLSNPRPMTRCSGCEAPNPSKLDGPIKLTSPIGIKRAPITPMKPASSNGFKILKEDKTLKCELNDKKDDDKKESKPTLVSFSLPKQTETEQTTPTTVLKLANMENPLLKFKKANNWTCDTCMLSNAEDVDKCKACETAKPGEKKTSSSTTMPLTKDNPLLAFKQSPSCTTMPLTKDNPLLAFKQSAGWNCDTCMLRNTEDVTKCKACETLKPGVKAEDIKEEKKEEENKPSMFKFGVSSGASADTAAPAFGATSSTFDFGGGSKTETKTTGFSFGATKPEEKKTEGETTTGGFKFGLSTATTDPPKPAFSFGTSATATETKTETKPAFSFGSTTKTSVADTKPDPKPAFSFGTSATSSAAETKTESKPAFNFGGKTAETAPAFSFGSSAPKAVTSAAPSFNFSTADKKEPAAPAFNFGGSDKPAEKPAFNFGGTAAPAFGEKKAETPSTGFSFGSSTTPTPAPAFNFGGSDAKPTPVAPFSFGSATTAEKPAAPTFNFGTATPAPTGFQFGAPSSAQPGNMEGSGDTMDASSQSPKGFQFGQAKPAVTNGPSFNFGGTSNSSAPPTNAFNFSASNNTNTPSFGASNNSTTTPAPFSFGQSSTNTSTGFNFGANSTPAAPTAFNFSAQTSQPASTAFNFGGSNNTNNSTPAPAFNFGGGVAPTFGGPSAQPAPAKPTFNFGGNAGTSTPSASFGASTTFGTPSQSAAPTFNFGGGNTTPSNSAFQFGSPSTTPSQNSTPSTNMFNPVSSSTGNRKIRKAVRRTKR